MCGQRLRSCADTGSEFVKHVVPAVMKPARTLWNEVIGFLFFCLAVYFRVQGGALAWDYAKPHRPRRVGDLFRLVIAGFCTLVMLWFRDYLVSARP